MCWRTGDCGQGPVLVYGRGHLPGGAGSRASGATQADMHLPPVCLGRRARHLTCGLKRRQATFWSMSQEIIIPLLIIAGAIVFFLFRRWSELPAPKLPPSEPATGEQAPQVDKSRADLVLITHSLIRMAAERALAKGGEAAKFVVKEGDNIYLSFDRIEDPAQRQKAVDLITSIQAKQDVDMTELMQLLRRMLEV